MYITSETGLFNLNHLGMAVISRYHYQTRLAEGLHLKT